MSKSVSAENQITEGSIVGALLAFFFPILLGTLFQQLYNTADAVVVGNFVGTIALAAVGGSTSTLISLFVNLFVGIASGTTDVIAQRYGARDFDGVRKAVHSSIAIGVVGGLISMVITFVGAVPALVAMDTPANVVPDSALYLHIYAIGMVPSFLYNIGSGILRAIGDTKRPLYFLIIACLTNIVLDLLFVPVFKMGIRGAALATVIAQAVSAAYMIIYISRKMEFMRVRFKKAYMDMVLFKECIRLSLPKIFQALAMSMGAMALQSVNNYFGVDAVAAISTAYKIDSLSITPIMYMSSAVSIFTGQNLGAKKPERAKEGLRKGCAIAFSLSLLVSALLVFFGRDFLSLFGISQRSVELGGRFFLFCAFFYPVMGVYNAMTGFLQGLKDVAFVSFVSIFTMVIRIAVSFAMRDVIGEDVIAVAECVNWTVGFAMCLIRVRGKERFLKSSGKTY